MCKLIRIIRQVHAAMQFFNQTWKIGYVVEKNIELSSIGFSDVFSEEQDFFGDNGTNKEKLPTLFRDHAVVFENFSESLFPTNGIFFALRKMIDSIISRFF